MNHPSSLATLFDVALIVARIWLEASPLLSPLAECLVIEGECVYCIPPLAWGAVGARRLTVTNNPRQQILRAPSCCHRPKQASHPNPGAQHEHLNWCSSDWCSDRSSRAGCNRASNTRLRSLLCSDLR